MVLSVSGGIFTVATAIGAAILLLVIVRVCVGVVRIAVGIMRSVLMIVLGSIIFARTITTTFSSLYWLHSNNIIGIKLQNIAIRQRRRRTRSAWCIRFFRRSMLITFIFRLLLRCCMHMTVIS